jgi:hypothetical protein|tara:strand:- start:3982 stop:4284 length:303 start_codon:yes stop_codon:yes gene_type:complete
MAKAEEKIVSEESVVDAPEGVDMGEELQQPESISLQDLQTLLQIVDLSSQRGAFRGAELTQVGVIFDKLNTFLTYVAEQQAAQEGEEGAEGEAEAPAEGE